MDFKKVTVLGLTTLSILIIALAVSTLALKNLAQSTQTKALTIPAEDLIVMDSQQVATSDPQLLAPYKTYDSFISNEISPGFEFTSVGGSWNEIAPEGTMVNVQVKFKNENKWSEWIDLEEEEDFSPENNNDYVADEDGHFHTSSDTPVTKYAMASTDKATALKYRFIFYGDGTKVPLVQNVDWTYIKTAPEIFPTISTKSTAKPKYSADTGTLVALENNPTGVISRTQWGANESLRYLSDNSITPQLVQLDPDFYDKYAEELGYSRVVEADEKGDKYKWPLQYPEKVSKIVIHHTAGTNNLDNPTQAIRDIYHYHAITRGWGDIGYNYIVDQQGNIYEGRYGGEGVIGAHSGAGNHGSIGIAILGNYQESEVPQDAIVKLSQFIYKKSKIHDIATDGTSEFRGKDRPNIFGHRDIMATACPGEFLYNKIPVVRVLSAQRFDLKEKFVKDYAFQDHSEIYYLEVKPNQSRDVKLKLENIGKVDWNSQTYIELSETDDMTSVVSFPGKQSNRLATMQESSVKPGETATFNFTVNSHNKAKTVYLNLKPVINGSQAAEDNLVIPLTVQQPVYKYQFVGGKMPPQTMKAGTAFEGFIRLENNGNVDWTISGSSSTTVYLKSNSLGILGSLQEGVVQPGETGTFNFTFTAPPKAGVYKEIFNPVMEGASWISSNEVSFETTVYEREYHGEVISKTTKRDWEQGKNYTISINMRNIGINEWTDGNLKATVVKEKTLEVEDLSMTPKTVKPGQSATMSFTVKIAANEELDEQVMLVRPMMNGFRLANKPSYFQYRIVEPKLQTVDDETQPKIRVKLGFEGLDPEITANGTFDVMAGQNLLTTLSAGEIAKVTREGDKYRVKAGETNFVKAEEIRFLPKTNSILKIKNYEHRPSWNETLNDNEYRGALEVREIDGKLVVVNELYLEDYLKGLGEVSNTELTEKIKSILVAARTYAKYYIDVDQKFPGKPYHLDDNPDVSQKYLGYGFEKRAPNIASAVEDTKGKVVTFDGKLVKTPYFNQSDGVRTKSAQEVWGWTTTPWLVSVSDTTCTGGSGQFLGHGVGMSGCGAKGMAENGSTFTEILQHYYTGIEITDLY